jgi:ectoine hydroxylase-related dioxygenase (phytanoyl-CoA dioxygenase family)
MKVSDLENLFKYGFVHLPSFFDKKLIDNIKREIISKEKKIVNELIKDKSFNKLNYGIENNSLKYLNNSNFWFQNIKFLINKPFFNILNKLIKFNFYIDNIELHQKKPGTSITPPHQDNFYFGLDLKKNFALTAYIALNNQNKKMGNLGFYPKSNHKNFIHHPSNVIGFSSGINPNDLKDETPFIPSLKAGDLIIHHCNIVHFAKKNIFNRPRINLAIRIMPTHPKNNDYLKKIYNEFKLKSKRK